MTAFSAGTAFRLSALLGFLGVALGALGAHRLQEVLAARQTADTWKTAVLYHLFHAAVLLGLATLRPWPRTAWLCLLVGVLGFSGSLYVYALTQTHWLVFVTPFGGLSLLVGWLALAFRRTEPADSPWPLP